MCGVVAYFAYHRAAPAVSREAIEQVSRALSARGPDGRGEWFSDDGRVALAHRRLAIIGPGEQGEQPMSDSQQAHVLSFNGAIYNHVQLRDALIERGHSFRGSSDSEVLLAMYREYGEDMLPMLRGMFAFALWDAGRGELVLARDAYGIKPLYYADDGWVVRVASQVRALACDRAISTDPDPAGWAGFWLLGSVPEPFTTVRAIRSVPAGAVIRIGRAGPMKARRWFNLAAAMQVAPNRDPDPVADLREALKESVAAHFVADVPVGVFLSAGLDSAVLLALAGELGHRPQAITLAFDEFAGSADDESVLAARLAARYGVQHRVRRVSGEEFRAQIPALLAAMDQPSIDGVNAWFVSKAAAECGLKVALSGVGGDELMAGYPSFRQLPWLARLGKFPARVPGLRDALRALAVPLARAAGWHPKLPGLLCLAGSYERAWLLRRGVFMPWELPALMGEEAAAQGLARLQPLQLLREVLDPPPRFARAQVCALESAMYLRNQLLRDADWAGMAHGVEIRTPLVDSTLLSALAPRLMHRASGEGKGLLAQVPVRRLDREVINRPKTGFQVPLRHWLREHQGSARNAIPAHVNAVRQWAQQVAKAQ